MHLLQMDALPKEKLRLLRLAEVMSLTGLSRSSIYLKMKHNEFPNQIQIGARSVAWLENEIQEWIFKSMNKRVLN